MSTEAVSVDVLAAQVRAALTDGCNADIDEHVTSRLTEDAIRGAWQPAFSALDALVARVTEAERRRDQAHEQMDAAANETVRVNLALADARNALEDIADPSCARAAWQLKLVARRVLARLDGSRLDEPMPKAAPRFRGTSWDQEWQERGKDHP